MQGGEVIVGLDAPSHRRRKLIPPAEVDASTRLRPVVWYRKNVEVWATDESRSIQYIPSIVLNALMQGQHASRIAFGVDCKKNASKFSMSSKDTDPLSSNIH